MSDDNDYENDNDNDDVETDLNDTRHYSTTISFDSEDEDSSFRHGLRQQLQSDVEAFLASGGKITEVPPNVVSDPPKKPQSNYGGQPI